MGLTDHPAAWGASEAPSAFVDSWWRTAGRTIWAYGELVKPRMVALLAFTAIVGMAVAAAAPGSVPTLPVAATGVAAIVAGTAGCNALTGYLDRDIDRVMERTRHRPLCTGRIAPAYRAVAFGGGLLVVALVLSGLRNPLSLAFMTLGIVDNVGVYSLWLKRTSRWNIVLGGIAGGMPVAFGWSYIAGSIGLATVLLAALVVLWTPTHIWSLALRYREDYARAGVPMLPVVADERTALRYMVVTGALLVPFSLLLPFTTRAAGTAYDLVAVAASVPLLAMSVRLWLRPTRDRAWRLFKFSSPYLAVIFATLLVSALW